VPDFPSDAERSKVGKNALRNRLLALRALKSTPERLSAAESLQAALLSLVRAEHRSTIAAYVPVGSEPGGTDLPDVLRDALPAGGRLLLPLLLNDGDLDWAAYTGTLLRGPRGLREPVGERLGVDAIGEASLVVVPALAVSSTGVRLGRGGGSYDRALARVAATALTVALLYDGELVDVVPAEAHDRAVRATITPSGGLTLS
jgi:5-formyltetrahydrofolate cyclo-ligase